jgi:hypothetical protein
MYKITRYKFCSELQNSVKALPPDKTDRCREFPQLVQDARTLDNMAARRLVDHISCKFLIPLVPCRSKENNDRYAGSHGWVQTEVVHVRKVLPGGTCVPNRRRRLEKLSPEHGSTTNV